MFAQDNAAAKRMPDIIEIKCPYTARDMTVVQAMGMTKDFFLSESRNLFLTLYVLLLRENINIYLHFMSFLPTSNAQVVAIPSRVRQGPAYST